MRITKSSLLSLGFALALALGTFAPARAFVVVDQVAQGCGSLTASGTTNQPFVTFYAYHYPPNIGEYFEVIPVVGGAFSYTFNFPPPANPGQVNYEVWGSPSDYVNLGDPGYWDSEAYYDADGNCSIAAIPTLDVRGVALLVLLLGAAGFFVLRRRAQPSH